GQVHAAELRHRIVSVVVEDALVKLIRALRAHALRRRSREARALEELVEKQPAQRLGRSGIPREERALHRFRKIDERKDRAIGVREVRRNRSGFGIREARGRTRHAAHSSASVQKRRYSSMNASDSRDLMRSKNRTPSR